MKNKEKQKIESNREYIGEVRENLDPNNAGRCQVFVADIMEGMDENLIPWATPGNTFVYAGDGGGNLSVPKKGTSVKVRFKDGDIMSPEYYGVQKIDKNLINEIKDDYEGSQTIMYDHDEDLSIMFQRQSGLRLYYKGSYVQISPNGMITVNHAGDTAIIQLQGNKMNITTTNEITLNSENTINVESKIVNVNASESTYIKGDKLGISPEVAVNGNELFNYLMFLAQAVDAKYPPAAPICSERLNTLKPKILNSKIKYV